MTSASPSTQTKLLWDLQVQNWPPRGPKALQKGHDGTPPSQPETQTFLRSSELQLLGNPLQQNQRPRPVQEHEDDSSRRSEAARGRWAEGQTSFRSKFMTQRSKTLDKHGSTGEFRERLLSTKNTEEHLDRCSGGTGMEWGFRTLRTNVEPVTCKNQKTLHVGGGGGLSAKIRRTPVQNKDLHRVLL